jgi:hypothetical protein
MVTQEQSMLEGAILAADTDNNGNEGTDYSKKNSNT